MTFCAAHVCFWRTFHEGVRQLAPYSGADKQQCGVNSRRDDSGCAWAAARVWLTQCPTNEIDPALGHAKWYLSLTAPRNIFDDDLAIYFSTDVFNT